MPNKRYRLPQVAFFQGFEAAARNLSFTKAAEELFLTQSAVSRQIKTLEDQLGVALFERRPRSLILWSGTPSWRRTGSRTSGDRRFMAIGVTSAAGAAAPRTRPFRTIQV